MVAVLCSVGGGMEYEHWGHRIYLFILTLDPSLVAVFIQGLNVPGTQC